MKFLPKKSLGQNFLLNPTTIDKILKVAGVSSADQILEIGPGPGVMTRKLAEKALTVIAVEKDSRFVHLLREELKDLGNLKIIEADILSLNLMQTLEGGKKWKVVANLPYNISTQALFHLLEMSTLFSHFYLMFQREVAQRIVAGPGGKDYGILSIFSQILSVNRIVLRLPPGAFTPPPKIDSALVEFTLQETPRFEIHHFPTFETTVQGAFSTRRKMIRNCLKCDEKDFRSCGIDPESRAETVSIAQFARLSNLLYSQQQLG